MNGAAELINNMTSEEYQRLVLGLTLYARRVAGGYRWRTSDPHELSGGHTVETIAAEAIAKAWLGERRWDETKQPDFKKYLRDVVDSLINHLANSKDNELVTKEPEAGTGSKDEQQWHTGSPQRKWQTDWMVRHPATPEEELLEHEEAEDATAQSDRMIVMLLEEAQGDEELTYFIQALLDGYEKSGEIAEVTGIAIRDVYNIRKRFDRKAAVVRQRLTGGGMSNAAPKST